VIKKNIEAKVGVGNISHTSIVLVYTEFVLRKSCVGSYKPRDSLPNLFPVACAMRVKFLAQGNKDLLLTGFEPTQVAILRLLVQHVKHSAIPPHQYSSSYSSVSC
jgi:hypothetical protein